LAQSQVSSGFRVNQIADASVGHTSPARLTFGSAKLYCLLHTWSVAPELPSAGPAHPRRKPRRNYIQAAIACPMTRSVLAIVFLLSSAITALAQSAATDAVPVLTLEQAISEAQQSNRLIKISLQNVLYANDEILAARTQRYPHFDVQIFGSYLLTPIDINFPKGVFGNVGNIPIPVENSTITTNPHFSSLGSAQVFQPLTHLYDAHLNIGLLQAGKKLSEEQLRQQRQQIAASVKQAYYRLLQTQSALEAAEEGVSALQEIERTTEQYVQEKTVLPYQQAGVKVQLAQAELQLVTLQNNMDTQKENLNNLMGHDIRSDFRLSGVPDTLPQEQNLDLARQTALNSRTEIRQAQFKVDQAMFAKRLQKAQYIPEIGAQYLLFSPFDAKGLPRYINSVGFSLKWDIYDWGYKRHLLDEKQRTIEQGQLNLSETRNQVVIDLDDCFRKLREARANLKVAELAQDAEKQKLRVVVEQYKQKAALLSALQTEQANMAQTAAQYQQALANFWSARADFEKALGED